MAGSQQESKDPRPSEYAREALSEWGKATRYAARAAMTYAAARKAKASAGDRPPLLERLNPAKTDKGGRLGSVADTALAKLGGPGGKLASKVGAGSRAVERLKSSSRNGGSEASSDGGSVAQATKPAEAAAHGNGNGFHGHAPIPIQESIEVAVPVGVAYDVVTKFEDYPDFLDRVETAERVDETHVAFVAKVRGRARELNVEIAHEHPRQRLDWECTGEIAHSGVISFHELAPRLTHIELTVELEPEGVLDRVTRGVGLTQRAIRADLHRFKAYTELFEPEDQEAEAEEEDEEPKDQKAEADQNVGSSGRELTKDQLLEQAQRLDISGRSTMTKPELERAVAEEELEDDEDAEDDEQLEENELVDEEDEDLDDDDEDVDDDNELVDEEDEDLDDDEELVDEEDLEDEELEDEDFEDDEEFEDDDEFEDDEEFEADEQPDPARAWR